MTNRSLAVFLWTFRRTWKGFVIFIAANAVVVFAIVSIYPEFSELRGKAIAEALGGDMEVSLTRNGKASGDYILSWSKYGGADGYVVVQSDTEIPPLSLLQGLDLPRVDLRLLQAFIPIAGRMSIHTFDAVTTQTHLTGLDEEHAVYFAVLAFQGEESSASIEGSSLTVNTRNMVATGAYDKLLEHPLMKSFMGGKTIDIYSIKGFLCMEFFAGSLTLFILVYFVIQYAGAFSCEMENKTIDIILSTPLSRRCLFISRYLSWAAMNLIMVLSWIVFLYLGVLAIGEGANAPLADIARTMISFLPFMLSVQGFCMLASVVTNQSRKAYAACFGVYYGMHVLEMVAMLSERLEFLKYLALFHYWDSLTIFIDGLVPWGDMIVLTILSVGLFIAGLAVFERKDLAA